MSSTSDSNTVGPADVGIRTDFIQATKFEHPLENLRPIKLRTKKSREPKEESPPDELHSDNDGIDEKVLATFPTGRPLVDKPEIVECKHCRRPLIKATAAEHIKGCLKVKQEKARKKKEAKEAREAAQRAKEKIPTADESKEAIDGEATKNAITLRVGSGAAKKSATKTASENNSKKNKKRKAEGEGDKEPKKKKTKKEEAKAKVPKQKGPVDVERQCGVPLPQGGQCARSLTCKSHSMGAKRAVPGRSLPYDMLLAAYQKKNQARQQKAAINANAPLQDDFENTGPIDSDEETKAIMDAITRTKPQPLEQHVMISCSRKYQYIRMKEMLSNALSGSRGSGLFAVGEPEYEGRLSSPIMPGVGNMSPMTSGTSIGQHVRKASLTQQAMDQRRAVQAQTSIPGASSTKAVGTLV